MSHVPLKVLEALVQRINQITESPVEPHLRDDWQVLHAQIGNFHLTSYNGFYSLVRTANSEGGIRTVLDARPKTSLLPALRALITGIEIGKQIPPKSP